MIKRKRNDHNSQRESKIHMTRYLSTAIRCSCYILLSLESITTVFVSTTTAYQATTTTTAFVTSFHHLLRKNDINYYPNDKLYRRSAHHIQPSSMTLTMTSTIRRNDESSLDVDESTRFSVPKYNDPDEDLSTYLNHTKNKNDTIDNRSQLGTSSTRDDNQMEFPKDDKDRELMIKNVSNQSKVASRNNVEHWISSIAEPMIRKYKNSRSRKLRNDKDDPSQLNDQRYCASDWLHNIRSLSRSSVLREIRGPVGTVMIWSILISLVYKCLLSYHPTWALLMCLHSTQAHSLTVSAIGLLLVFRTNSAYERFKEGRKIWQDIHCIVRNLSRMIYVYSNEYDIERRQTIFQLLSSFPYLLHRHVMPSNKQCNQQTNDDASNIRNNNKKRNDISFFKSSFTKQKLENNNHQTTLNNNDNVSKYIIRIRQMQQSQSNRQSLASRKVYGLHQKRPQRLRFFSSGGTYSIFMNRRYRKSTRYENRQTLQYDDIVQDDNADDNVELSSSLISLKKSSCYECYVDRRMVPWSLIPPNLLNLCANSDNHPLWVLDRISYEITQVAYNSDKYTSFERIALLGYVDKLSKCIDKCERIHQTTIPLNYARHSLRALTVWSLTLPFALVKYYGWYTGITMGLVSWMLYGIYQIGYTIEDPFQGSLRLRTYCDEIYRDIINMNPKEAVTTKTTKMSTTVTSDAAQNNNSRYSNTTTIIESPRVSAFHILKDPDFPDDEDDINGNSETTAEESCVQR